MSIRQNIALYLRLLLFEKRLVVNLALVAPLIAPGTCCSSKKKLAPEA